jgi:hypothetical protein
MPPVGFGCKGLQSRVAFVNDASKRRVSLSQQRLSGGYVTFGSGRFGLTPMVEIGAKKKKRKGEPQLQKGGDR